MSKVGHQRARARLDLKLLVRGSVHRKGGVKVWTYLVKPLVGHVDEMHGAGEEGRKKELVDSKQERASYDFRTVG